MIGRAAVLVCLFACGRDPAPPPGSADDLARYLRGIAGADEPTRRREVTGWILDESAWRRIVVEPYRDLWIDYTHAFDAEVAPLVARLDAPGELTTRRHFAGDPRLTPAQARLRWAVPVQYPSMVAELGGAPIDAVFVFDGGHWRVLAGLDAILLARVRVLDPACAERLARAGPAGHCTEVAWSVADAALRTDRARFTHACQLAATLCGTASP